jgi:hypothetical protein
MRSRRPHLLFSIVIATCLAPAGCDSSRDDYHRSPTSQTAATTAASWESQLADVRDGRSTAIAGDFDALTAEQTRDLVLLDRLTELQLPRYPAIDEFAVGIAKLKALQVLVLGETAIGGKGWAAITGLTQLKRLNLASCNIHDADLAKLPHLAELESLRLGSPNITDVGLPHIAELPKLRHLILRQMPISDTGVIALAKLPRLESLYLEGTQVTEAGERELLRLRPDLHLHFP